MAMRGPARHSAQSTSSNPERELPVNLPLPVHAAPAQAGPRPLPALPVTRAKGRWHLTIGGGTIAIDDASVTRDLDALSALLFPGTATGAAR